MRYIWQSTGNPKRRVMHIAQFNRTGEMLMVPLCHVRLRFDRSINAPFGLGQRICGLCCRFRREELDALPFHSGGEG